MRTCLLLALRISLSYHPEFDIAEVLSRCMRANLRQCVDQAKAIEILEKLCKRAGVPRKALTGEQVPLKGWSSMFVIMLLIRRISLNQCEMLEMRICAYVGPPSFTAVDSKAFCVQVFCVLRKQISGFAIRLASFDLQLGTTCLRGSCW